MIKASVNVKSRIPDVMKALERAQQQGLIAGAEMIESDAKKTMTDKGIVDTGRLRGSLSYTVNDGQTVGYEPVEGSADDDPVRAGEKNTAIIGTNVFYGKFIEFGTSKMKARPFLRPAFDANVAKIKKLFINLYQKAVN